MAFDKITNSIETTNKTIPLWKALTSPPSQNGHIWAFGEEIAKINNKNSQR
jgi:hypothetical protein